MHYARKVLCSFTIQMKMRIKSILLKFLVGENSTKLPIDQLPVETPTSLGSDFQDYLVAKTLIGVLEQSCYSGLVRRKYNLLTPLYKYTSPLAILAEGLGLGSDLRSLFGILDSWIQDPQYFTYWGAHGCGTYLQDT